jgi:hypothetical protein
MEYPNPILTASTDLAHTVRLQGRPACLRLLLVPSVLALELEEGLAQTPLLPVLLLLEVLVVNGPLEMLLATTQITGVVRSFLVTR